MARYSFRNQDTGEEWELGMTFAERERYVETLPANVKQVTRGAAIGDTIRMGKTKPPDFFRDRLRDIRDSHVGSTIDVR